MKLTDITLWIGTFLKSQCEGVIPLYPVVAAMGAPTSFCIYRRTRYTPDRTKDGLGSVSFQLQLSIACPSYGESLEKAQEIIDRLDSIRGLWGGVVIERFELSDCSEVFSEDAYVQTLYFEIEISSR